MMVDIGDLVPEGEVKTLKIQLHLTKGSVVELNLKYAPTDD